MEFDSFPPLAAVPGLVSQMQAGANHNFNLGPTYSSNPFIWFNSVSPNNGSALSKVAVRQALSYGLSRAHLTQVINPTVNPPLTHVLPDGINGVPGCPVRATTRTRTTCPRPSRCWPRPVTRMACR